jgi:CheY-like chemotaxis protein
MTLATDALHMSFGPVRRSARSEAAAAVDVNPWALGALAVVVGGGQAGAAPASASGPRRRRSDPACVTLSAASERRAPRQKDERGDAAGPAAAFGGAPKRVRVVIADDDRLFATGLKALLAYDDRIDVVGYAANGEEAISLVNILKPDLVLVDLHMPVVGGFEVARKVLMLGGRVVIVTGSEDPDDVTTAHAMGVPIVLSKRLGLDELVARISDVAASIQRRRD